MLEPATIEEWALAYVEAPDRTTKLYPPPVPDRFGDPPPAWDVRPGRGPDFRVSGRAHKSTGSSALRSDAARARLLHTFLHHELQAAELMAWAIIAFASAPEELRRGLLKILFDEIRHMRMYAEVLEERGVELGSFEVRDWFWERVPNVRSIDAFLATIGMGFEGANLDHAESFAARFRRASDHRAAEVEEQVGREEIPHVRFATRWFTRLSPLVEAGLPLFEAFRRSLPPPLSPLVMKGKVLSRRARAKAGLDEDFLDRLERWQAAGPTDDSGS